jgi:hypothetical protein
MAKNEKAGLDRDAALQKAVDDIAAQQGVDREALLTKLGTTEAGLKTTFETGLATVTGQIQDSEKRVLDQMAKYEQAGIDRASALDLAIKDVSKQLNVAEKDLARQILGVEELIGRPQQAVTQDDINAARQMLQPDQKVDLSYDVDKDGKITQRDIDLLEGYFAKPDTFEPPDTSRWSATGVFGKINQLQTELSRQIIKSEQTTTDLLKTNEQKALERETALKDQMAKDEAALRLQLSQAQQRGNFGSMLGLLGAGLGGGGGGAATTTAQQVEPAKIGYVYDWSDIFATPQQAQMFTTPYGERTSEDELLNILRG